MKRKTKLILTLSIVALALLSLITVGVLAACSASIGGNGSIPSDTETDTVSSPDFKDQAESDGTSLSTGASDLETSESEPNEEKESEELSEDESVGETLADEGTVITEEQPAPEPALEFESLGNGTCAVVGIGDITDTYVIIPHKSPDGDVVTEIGDKAFFGNAFLRAVEIPSTVSVIGDMAFADCGELVYIAVDKSNKMFTDIGGILYSADMSRLIAYPSASGASSITLSTSVKVISPMAFYGCENLKIINYDGSFEEWSRIIVGEMNYGLISASVVCKKAE